MGGEYFTIEKKETKKRSGNQKSFKHAAVQRRECSQDVRLSVIQKKEVIQRITYEELQEVADTINRHFGCSISVDNVYQILKEYYSSSGRPLLRNWMDKIDYDWALNAVESTILHSPRPEYFHCSFGDKDLAGGIRAIGRGETPMSTYLEPGIGVEENQEQILKAGGQVMGDVRIGQGKITQGEEEFHISTPGEATSASFDFPWTTGWPTNRETQQEVHALTTHYAEQMLEEGVATMSMTVKAFQDRGGHSFKAANRHAYNMNPDGFYPISVMHADPHMGHSKTAGGKSTVHPATEGVTVKYGNLKVLFGPLYDAASRYLLYEDNEDDFLWLLQRDVFATSDFPTDLKDNIQQNATDLSYCASAIVNYQPQPVDFDSASAFDPKSEYPPVPDQDRAYRREGFREISFL